MNNLHKQFIEYNKLSTKKKNANVSITQLEAMIDKINEHKKQLSGEMDKIRAEIFNEPLRLGYLIDVLSNYDTNNRKKIYAIVAFDQDTAKDQTPKKQTIKIINEDCPEVCIKMLIDPAKAYTDGSNIYKSLEIINENPLNTYPTAKVTKNIDELVVYPKDAMLYPATILTAYSLQDQDQTLERI